MEKIVQAFELAFRAHKGAVRKGSAAPYIVHPMDVASTLMKNKAREEVAIAGLLHDLIEDTEVVLSHIEDVFGSEVASLVKGASEPEELREGTTKEEKKKTWKDRKKHTIEFIQTATRDQKMVSCADKLSNLRDTLRDYKLNGDELWKKFNSSREDQKWYYFSMRDSFSKGENSIEALPMFSELCEVIDELFK